MVVFISLRSLGHAKRAGLLALLFAGCVYDYSALGRHAADAGAGMAGGTGGTATGLGAAGGQGGQSDGNGELILTSTGGAGSGPAGTGGVDSGGIAPAEAATGGIGTGGTTTPGSGSGENPTGGTAGIDSGEAGAAGGEAGKEAGMSGAGGTEMAPGQPLILSIDFIGGRPTTPAGIAAAAASVMAPSEIAGVKPASQWNGAPGPSGSLAGLTLSTGTVTTASVTWNSPSTTAGPGVWTKAFVDAAGDAKMMNGYLDPLGSSTPATVVVTGLPAAFTASGYDVYVYATGEIRSATTRTCKYAIGTTSLTASEMGPTPTTFAGFGISSTGGLANTLLFKNVTGASFTLTATPGTTQTPRAPVNGIQIVSPAGS